MAVTMRKSKTMNFFIRSGLVVLEAERHLPKYNEKERG